MSKIVIAGGTGFLGGLLESALLKAGHEVVILTRQPRASNHLYWNPSTTQVDLQAILDAEVVVNLCGSGIADKRWTASRKKELYTSRIETTQFLCDIFDQSKTLRQYISASGINCYPISSSRVYTENDPYGEDFVSQLVKKWEGASDSLQSVCSVYHMRISMVLHPAFGALKKMSTPIKLGLGSVLGSGQQPMTWIHHEDLVQSFLHIIANRPASGSYNLTGEVVTNQSFTHQLAKVLKRPILLPKVPGFVLKLVLGSMSQLLLTGIKADPNKLIETGFSYRFPTLEEALSNLYQSK